MQFRLRESWSACLYPRSASRHRWGQIERPGATLSELTKTHCYCNSALHTMKNIQIKLRPPPSSQSDFFYLVFVYSIVFKETCFPMFSGRFLWSPKYDNKPSDRVLIQNPVPLIGEQIYISMYFQQFSRNADMQFWINISMYWCSPSHETSYWLLLILHVAMISKCDIYI